MNGTSKLSIVGNRDVANYRSEALYGTSYVADGDGLDGGNCTLDIESVTEDHGGLWSCTLISQNSTVFSGAFHVG